MSFCQTALLILLGLHGVVSEQKMQGEETARFNILKGLHQSSSSDSQYQPYDLCDFQDIMFRGHVVHSDTSKVNLMLRIEAFSTSDKRYIGSYEITDLIIKPGDAERQVTEQVGKQICGSLGLNKRVINGKQLFSIKFNNNDEWWCDVFSGFDFKHKETDKCDELFRDFDALEDNTYYSVELPSDEEMDLDWTSCSNSGPEDLCNLGTFQLRGIRKCRNGRNIYQVIAYYSGTQLGTYIIASFRKNSIDETVDGVKVCKLFRYKPHEKEGNKVRVQYLKNGSWEGQTFERKTHKNSQYYVQQSSTTEKSMRYHVLKLPN